MLVPDANSVYEEIHYLYNGDVATGTRPYHRPIVEYSMIIAITEYQ